MFPTGGDDPSDARTGRVVRVIPDQTGLDKTFDYLVPSGSTPDGWGDEHVLGAMVRIQLGSRRSGAWIVDLDVEPPSDVEIKPLAKVSGLGPDPDLVDLARWARWRWASRTPVPFLRTASPPRMVHSLPPAGTRRHPVPTVDDERIQSSFEGAGTTVLRIPPAADLIPVVQAAAAVGDVLYVCPTRSMVDVVAGRLERAGVPVSRHPAGWAEAAGGGVSVVGTRAAVWARMPSPAAIVVFDEHDETHQEEGSPTWHAREVAIERARRGGIPCVLTSPVPSLEALAAARPMAPRRSEERDGWPAVIVADRREEDVARNALFSPALVDILRRGRERVVCVLNQKGRAAMLACRVCGDLARCERCAVSVQRPDDTTLRCRRCGTERPVVCAGCGSAQLKTVRMGVGRVREDLEALTGQAVAEVTGEGGVGPGPDARVVVGTEAVLHRVDGADVVAYLDLDQELFAPRYRAAEQAMALIVRGARLAGSRSGAGAGRLLLQTRDPEHEVVQAALHGDPTLVAEAERRRRSELLLPPEVAVAEVGGPAAEAFVESLRTVAPDGVLVQGPIDGRWRVRAPDHRVLCDALAAVDRPAGRLRLAVDPPRI